MFNKEGVISLIVNYNHEIGLNSDQFVSLTTNDALLNKIASEMEECLTTPNDNGIYITFDRGDMADIIAALKLSLRANHCL
jgi:hypothetical protein